MDYATWYRSPKASRSAREVGHVRTLSAIGILGAIGIAASGSNGAAEWLNGAMAASGLLLLMRLEAIRKVRSRAAVVLLGGALIVFALAGAAAVGFGGAIAIFLVCYSVCALIFDARTADTSSSPDASRRLHARLLAMSRASELHDQQTHGHSQRVAVQAVQIGAYLGLTDDDIDALHWAALLHDTGKTVIPHDILLKAGSLTQDQFDLVKSHSRAGSDAVMAVSPALRSIAEGIAAHHERWDGHGYPLGLAGEAIPLASRIIAVVDVFEALTSDRPYRDAIDSLAALDIIRAGAGTHFDPDIVAVFELLWLGNGGRKQVQDGAKSVAEAGRSGGSFFRCTGPVASLMEVHPTRT